MQNCSSVFVRIGNAFLILALIATTGGHWMLLQSIAWERMLTENLRTSSFAEAVETTFDGKHPCCLCKQIAEGRKSEKKSEFSFQFKQVEFLPPAHSFAFFAPVQFNEMAATDDVLTSISHTPPTPPPRTIPA